MPSITLAVNEKYKLLESIPFIGTQGSSDINFSTYLLGIFKFAIASVAIASLVMITIGGYLYIISAGNQSRSGHAKEIIWNALIGLIVSFFVGILFLTINPDIMIFNPLGPSRLLGQAPSNIDGYFSSANGREKIGEDGGGIQTESDPAPVNLPTGCDNYKSDFNSASSGDKNFGCLLYAIGTQESGCNPNAESGVGACGMMQFLPSTGSKYGLGTCAALKSNPKKSIEIAARFMNSNGRILRNYTFDHASIGSSNMQSGTMITVGPYHYDTGNDDLIASYNAGAGTKSKSGKKGPFAKSSDCPGLPVWQCHIDNEGFKETRDYVKKVQAYQKMCLDQNKL